MYLGEHDVTHDAMIFVSGATVGGGRGKSNEMDSTIIR
jgi:hypothetical protein